MNLSIKKHVFKGEQSMPFPFMAYKLARKTNPVVQTTTMSNTNIDRGFRFATISSDGIPVLICTMNFLPLITGKLKVLVVDDSLIISNRLKNLLQELEYIQFSGHAENYNDAVLFTDALKPHVLLLDINIKGKNGIDILKCVKKDYPSIKIIMFTSQSDKHYRNLCKELGADYFLDKFSEFESLTQVLEEIHENTKG